MTTPSDFLMDPACPWVGLRTLTGVPDIVWCEKQVCSWIATPANTWSNLAYLLVAVLLFAATRKEKAPNLRFYGVAAIWVGVSSFIYHASLAFATQVLDFLGMYIFFYLILTQNFARLGWIRGDQVKRSVWILTAITTALCAAGAKLGLHLQFVVMLLILLILVTEFFCSKRSVQKIRYGAYAVSLLFLGVGAFFSASDLTRRICEPENHVFQAHALWHLLNSVSLYLSVYHYRQFYSRATGELEV